MKGFPFSRYSKHVTSDEAVTRDRAVEGWIKVTIWEDQGDRLVVRLPRESFESGLFVTISSAQLQPGRASVEA